VAATRSLIARAVVVLSLAAPVLALAPLEERLLLHALLAIVAIVAACHGLGTAIAWTVRREAHPVLAIAWGLAAMILLAGLSLLLAISGQIPILMIGGVAHVIFGIRDFGSRTDRVAAYLAPARIRWWIVPAALVSVIGGLHVFGTLDTASIRAFDDDGNVLAQIARILDTGTLADHIGYARTTQLGAHATLGSIAAALAGLGGARLFEKLAFVLTLVYVARAIGARDASTSLCSSLLVLTLGALHLPTPDPLAPLWLLILLVIAAYDTLQRNDRGDADAVVPLALLVGAVGALRIEWLPIAAVFGIVGMYVRERGARSRALALVAGVLCVMLPYVIVRMPAAHLAPRMTLVQLALFAGMVAGASPLAWIATKRLGARAIRCLPLALIAGYAGIASRLTTSGNYGYRYLLPIAIAGLAIIALSLARRLPSSVRRFAIVLAVVTVASIYGAREARGRRRWSTRVFELATSIDYARASSTASPPHPYAELVSHVPAGATVAIAVLRPELVSYASHTIVDVRTPRTARLSSARLRQLVVTSGATYVIVEDRRFEEALHEEKVIASRDGVRLFALASVKH
jgi:hypothetical protein